MMKSTIGAWSDRIKFSPTNYDSITRAPIQRRVKDPIPTWSSPPSARTTNRCAINKIGERLCSQWSAFLSKALACCRHSLLLLLSSNLNTPSRRFINLCPTPRLFPKTDIYLFVFRSKPILRQPHPRPLLLYFGEPRTNRLRLLILLRIRRPTPIIIIISVLEVGADQSESRRSL